MYICYDLSAAIHAVLPIELACQANRDWYSESSGLTQFKFVKYALRAAVQTPLRNFVFPSGKNARSHASRELVRVSCVIDSKAEARKSNSNFTMFARQNFGREKFF